jgi:dynein heavy chain 1
VGLFIPSDRTRSAGCDRLFRDWFEHCSALINDSVSMTRMLSLKDVCCTQLQQLEQLLKSIAGCYVEHHQLLDVLNKIINSTDYSSAPSRAVTEACACISALKGSFEKVARIPLANLDHSQEIFEAIQQFSSDARAIEDRLADVMNQMLRPAADRKKLRDMFSVFSAFAPLIDRPKIKAYVENYQHVLFSAVQESVSMLLTRSRKLNSGSHAGAFATARGFAPIASHVICAGQIIRRLDSYRYRLQQVMGKDWEKTAADLPKKIENFVRQARPDSEVVAWMQEAANTLKETCVLFAAPLFHTIQRGGKHILAVNFDNRIANFVHEGMILHALGYASQFQAHTVEIEGSSVVTSLSFLMAELAPLLPVAASLTESLRQFGEVSQLKDKFSRILLADARVDVLKMIDEGTVMCWSIDLSSIRDEIKPFARRLSACVKNFIRLADHAHSLCCQFNAAVSSISSAPSSAANIAIVMSSVDQIVQEVELGGFANTQLWILEADAALERALVCRLSALLRTWATLLLSDDSKPNQVLHQPDGLYSEYLSIIVSVLKDAPIHQLNMSLQNSTEVLVCNPPISESMRFMVTALNSMIMSLTSLQRLIARTIKKSVSKKAATYSSLILLLPQEDLCAAYGAIMTTTSRAQGFVSQWQSLQVLWNSNPTEAAAMLETDLEKWRSVLSDIRRDRAQKNSSDTMKLIGPFRFDFSAAQSKVVQRYDLWYRSLMDLYTEQLNRSKAALLSHMNAARGLFESLSTNLSMDVSLNLVVAINEHDGSLQSWEKDISAIALGEALLSSQDGRTRLQVPSITLEHLRGALHSFEQIFHKRRTAAIAAKSVLQQHVFDEERNVMRLYEQLLKDWDLGKPDNKDCDAVSALNVLVGFNERCAELSIYASKVLAARRALCLDMSSNDIHRLTEQLKTEVSEMQFVWDSLSIPYCSLLDLEAIQLVAASTSFIRSQLDVVKTQAKALPHVVHQYAAYRGLNDRLELRARTLQIISDLKSPAFQLRHWQALARTCNISLPAEGVSLGFLWNSQLLHNDVALKEIISNAQGEFALHDFLDSIQSYWTNLKFEMCTVGRRALNIKGWDIMFASLTEHVTNMSSMKSSPYFKTFQEQASVWEDRLFRISQFLDALVDTQRKWIYLEGIFCGSGDIQSQIPNEASRFKSTDAEFISVMFKISRHFSVFDAVQDSEIKRSIDRVLESLAKIQKGLTEYLESKRNEFPRFYFVGDEDLLELLGNSNNIICLQQYLRKMFSGIAFLKLNAESAVAATLSPEGEVMQFEHDLAAPSSQSVSFWLDDLKSVVSYNLRCKEFSSAYASILSIYRDDSPISGVEGRVAEWMNNYVCQALITSLQAAWTSVTSSSMNSSISSYLQTAQNQTNRILSSISHISLRPAIDSIARKKCEHCILELVHQVKLVMLLRVICHSDLFFSFSSA